MQNFEFTELLTRIFKEDACPIVELLQTRNTITSHVEKYLLHLCVCRSLSDLH